MFSFGAKPAAPAAAPAAGGFKFAAAPTAAATAPAAAPAAGGFSFAAKPAAAPAAGGFSFAAKPAAPGAAGGFSFGAKPATGLAGAAVPAAPAVATAGVPLPSGAIPSATLHNPAASDPLIDRINAISRALDLASSHCRLQTVLYNKTNPAFLSQVVKPPHADAAVWARGVAANPDPTTLAPCLVVGFPDLERRLGEHHKAVQTHLDALAATGERVDAMRLTQQRHEAELDRLRSTAAALSQRVLRVASQADLLRARGVPLAPTELDLLAKLERIDAEVSGPGSRLTARVADASARVAATRDRTATDAGGAAAQGTLGGGEQAAAAAVVAGVAGAAGAALETQRQLVEELVCETALVKADVAAAVRVLEAGRR